MVVLHEHCDLKNVAQEPQNNTKKNSVEQH